MSFLAVMLLCAVSARAVEPGDVWTFELIGYQYEKTVSGSSGAFTYVYFIPPGFPGFADAFEGQEGPQTSVGRRYVPLARIEFYGERLLQIEYRDGVSYQGAFWEVQATSTDHRSLFEVERGFPLYELSFVDEEHSRTRFQIVPDFKGGGYLVTSRWLSGVDRQVRVVYKVDFDGSVLPEIESGNRRYMEPESLR